MEGLTLGRVVHVVDPTGAVMPGIVSRVLSSDEGIINVHVFTPNFGGPVRIVTSVPYAEAPVEGKLTWHWIERA